MTKDKATAQEILEAANQFRELMRDIQFSDEQDSNFNFRCNSELKKEFKKLCKSNQDSPSSVFKRYMLKCVRSSRIL